MYVSQFFQQLFNARYVSICFQSQIRKRKNLEIEKQKLNNICYTGGASLSNANEIIWPKPSGISFLLMTLAGH